MKVIHINCNYTGTTLHQKMIEKLEDRKIENNVFVPVHTNKPSVIQVNDNVKVTECFKKRDRLLFDYKQKKILHSIKQQFQLQEFKIIHAYTLFTDGNCARKISLEYGMPYVVAVRNTDVNIFFKYMFHLRKRGLKIMQEASVIFFLSEEYKRQVFNKYVPGKYRAVLEEKCIVLPNGIDDFWYDNLFTERNVKDIQSRFSEKKIRIVYAGVIDKNKNLALTIQALKQLRVNAWNVEFTIAGRIKDEKEYALIKNTDFCNYVGVKKKEELLHIYRENDLFVMPSRTETFGLVYAEALTQGLPVIYTRGQGFDGQFEEGEVGYSVDWRDSGELAEMILKCVDDYQELSQRALEGCNKFKWDSIVEKYIGAYKKLMR